MDDVAGIVREQELRSVLAKSCVDHTVRRGQSRRTVLRVVRVGGDDMDEAAVQQAEGGGARRAAESACDGERRDLGEASQFDPGFQPGEVSEEGLVALRMSHDGHDAGVQQLPQEGLGVPADVEAGEFEKHVGAGVDGVGGGAVEQGPMLSLLTWTSQPA